MAITSAGDRRFKGTGTAEDPLRFIAAPGTFTVCSRACRESARFIDDFGSYRQAGHCEKAVVGMGGADGKAGEDPAFNGEGIGDDYRGGPFAMDRVGSTAIRAACLVAVRSRSIIVWQRLAGLLIGGTVEAGASGIHAGAGRAAGRAAGEDSGWYGGEGVWVDRVNRYHG